MVQLFYIIFAILFFIFGFIEYAIYDLPEGLSLIIIGFIFSLKADIDQLKNK